MDDIIEYLSDKFNNFDYKKLIIPTIILLVYVAGFTYLYNLIDYKKIDDKKQALKIEEENIKSNHIYVDIKGFVNKPGVYKLDSDSRVIDAIKKSGGLKKDANTRFINLSKALNDGDVIVIYSNSEIKKAKKQDVIYVETPCVCEEVKNDACYKDDSLNETNKTNKTDKTNNANKTSKINLNTATLEELKTLNGIGDVKAKSIIEYRTKNGNFKIIDDLRNVKGISDTIYAKIKENITV